MGVEERLQRNKDCGFSGWLGITPRWRHWWCSCRIALRQGSGRGGASGGRAGGGRVDHDARWHQRRESGVQTGRTSSAGSRNGGSRARTIGAGGRKLGCGLIG